MSRRPVQLVAGLIVVAVGVYLVFSPLLVADLLRRPPTTPPQMINLRASWGGTLAGLGGFIAWLPSLRPPLRAVLGLLLAVMAGIGIARAIGFVLDGQPDTLQWIWLTAEAAIVLGCALGLRGIARRQAATPPPTRR